MATGSASPPAFASGDSLYSAHRRLSHRKVALLRHADLIRSSPARRRWRIACLLPSKGLDSSWMQDEGSVGEFGGWIFVKDEDDQKKKLDLGRLKTVGVGASAALVLAAFVQFSLSRRGYKLHFDVRFPFPKESLTSSESTISSEREDSEKSEILPEEIPVTADDALPSTFNIEKPASGAKKQTTVSVEADSTQKQALSVLNKLKIIEDNVKPGELCTRREYARWLVKANSLLERNPRHKIVLSGLTGSSLIPAFDDINVDDQDFIFIQALAEVGVVPSKLSADLDHQRHEFSPESFLSRLDMVDWRTQLEYLSNPMKKEMLRKNLGFIDLDSVGSSNAPTALLKDLLADDESIIRKVFGNSRRLQPHKPATKAQAAVALASGKMAAAIQAELVRREMEELTQSSQKEQIRREMISDGDIKSSWEVKVDGEKTRRLVIQEDYRSTLNSLEGEKVALESQLTDHVKERAALDCQRQLLLSLREDVDQLRDRLASERSSLLIERETLTAESTEWERRQETAAEARSVLEVEKEALRILRCWVEEEARKNQVRTTVLESAVQRWKWQGQVNALEDPRIDEPDEFHK